MKKTKNNSYIYAFYHSGLFLPFILFFIIVFINHCIFFYKNFLDYDWRYFLAFFGGCNHDFFFFSFTALLLAFVCKAFPFLKKSSLIILHLLLCLPVLDYFYFRATLERFNWIVLRFINYHSVKGYIGNMGMGLLGLILFIILLGISCFYSFKREKFAESYFFKPLASICIFSFFASFFTNNIKFPIEIVTHENTKLVFGGEYYKNLGKNRILKSLSSGSIHGFIVKKHIANKTNEFKPYTEKESKFLKDYGLLPVRSKSTNKAKFNKIIMIVLESFALDYIHAYNPNIPAEASPYLDHLTNNCPHLNNFYTSDFPSLQGFNAILSSKIPFLEQNTNKQKYNLASMLETKYPDSTWFLRGTSRAYGNEEIAVRNVFGFSHLIGYEDLAKKYSEPKGNVWGYEDCNLYNEAINILSNHKNTSLMIIKLLNQHQPVVSGIINMPNQPAAVSAHKNNIIKAIFDADRQIKDFIEKCESNSIIDDKTLVIITADHYPPLGNEHTELIKTNNHFQLGKLPLIFYSRQNEVFEKLNTEILCCQLDIAPTLCNILGLDTPDEYMGENLLSPDFKPRSIGILNSESLFFFSEKLEFSESLIKPATSTLVIKKWLNNLLVND